MARDLHRGTQSSILLAIFVHYKRSHNLVNRGRLVSYSIHVNNFFKNLITLLFSLFK